MPFRGCDGRTTASAAIRTPSLCSTSRCAGPSSSARAGIAATGCVGRYAGAAQADLPLAQRTAPRRIWFVVDRRIVVDEAFDRAQLIADKLAAAKDGPLKDIADRLRVLSGTERPLATARLRGGVLRDDGW